MFHQDTNWCDALAVDARAEVPRLYMRPPSYLEYHEQALGSGGWPIEGFHIAEDDTAQQAFPAWTNDPKEYIISRDHRVADMDSLGLHAAHSISKTYLTRSSDELTQDSTPNHQRSP
jgi:hypothetical protein